MLMTDNDLYRKLSALTKRKEEWKESIPHVASMLENQPLKITGKALWLLGEMGMNYPEEILPVVSQISLFLDSREALLRERALNALGRIGRSNYETVRPYWNQMMRLVTDNVPQVRLAFIWASENIATNTPDAYEQSLPVFAELLHDRDEWVRMEAPEMFRVMGKRRPGMVRPYLEILQSLAENDPNPVVRIHSAGAIRITNKELNGY
jgi:HEAT repeat protein